MINISRLKLLFSFTLLLLCSVYPAHSQAGEFKWLKAPDYQNIFVYTEIEDCAFLSKYLNETIRRVLARSGIKANISNSLVFQSADEEQSFYELLNKKLIDDNKVFIHVYGRCKEYGSVYIYHFDILFARFDKPNSQALLFSSPRNSVMGADTINGIKKTFRELMENAAEDYLLENK